MGGEEWGFGIRGCRRVSCGVVIGFGVGGAKAGEYDVDDHGDGDDDDRCRR